MRIEAKGVLNPGQEGTKRACLTFPSVVALASGKLLATGRAGADKDTGDEYIEVLYSTDSGENWSKPASPFHDARIGGHAGSLKLCYLTEIKPGHILAASMWVDRAAHPGKGLFNAKTEGCLPMAILLADSFDEGNSFSPWRQVDLPVDLGPPSLTNPLLKLADGTLLMSIETNKNYEDASVWKQKAVQLTSFDEGKSWSAPVTIARDPSARIFNWDLRLGVAPDGRLASFAWTYDSKTLKYLNIHRRVSENHGLSWSGPEDLGFADQAGPPAVLADGRVLLPFVDRFETQTIRARLAQNIAAPFPSDSDLVLYRHPKAQEKASGDTGDTGDLLAGMELWSFGLPFATMLANDLVLVTYYAGTPKEMSLHWVQLRV